VRAGVFLGLVTALLVVLLCRMVSQTVEYYAYDARTIPESTGIIITAILSGLILVGGLWAFTRPWMQKTAVSLEEMGWFHPIGYKANQGHRVRRGTIFGILLLVGAGVYTLISHGTLARGNPDWVVNIPFTGVTAIESLGDAKQFIAELPAASKNQVKVRYAGDTSLRVDQVVSFANYRSAVEGVINGKLTPQELKDAYGKAVPDSSSMDPTDYLLAVTRDLIWPRIKQLLDEHVVGEGATRRLRMLYDQSTWEDPSDIMEAFKRERRAMSGPEQDKPSLGAEFDLPVALLVLDRYVLRDVNDQTSEEKNVRIRAVGDSGFAYGAIVSREKFDERVAELKKKPGAALPVYAALESAWGRTTFASITLLPGVQFTVPLLLLAGSLWLAWRAVNMPAFADFLIATEAELNKVSWTTQKRLVQDTIVVLVTVVLMAVFLFGMDWTWKVVLSSNPIGVLHIPKEGAQQNKKVEEKRW